MNIFLLGVLFSIKLLGVYNKGMFDIGNGNVIYDSFMMDIILIVFFLGLVINIVMVFVGVVSYKVEVVLLFLLLKRIYLVKFILGNF